MIVASLMRRQVATAPPERSAREGARQMAAAGIGSLVVARHDRPLGIVTERDLVRRVLVEGRDPDGTSLHEIMSAPLATVPPSESVENAARKMRDLRLKRLVVAQEGLVIGIVSVTDLAYHESEILRSVRASLAEPEWRG